MEQMERPPAEISSPPRRRYGPTKRLIYAALWAFYTIVLVLGSFSMLGEGQVLGGLIGLVAAFFAGWYAYRIWMWRAKRLWLLIFF